MSAIDWPAIVTAVAALGAIFLGAFSIREQVRSDHLSRSLTAMTACEQRYRELESIRMRKADPTLTDRDIKSFFRAFWALKADQFDYFLAGYVDYDTFNDWCDSIARHFRKGEDTNFFGITFIEGWIHVARAFHEDLNPMFVAFHDAIQIHELPKPNAARTGPDADVVSDLIGRLDAANTIHGLSNSLRFNKLKRFGAAGTWADYRDAVRTIKAQIADHSFRYSTAPGYIYAHHQADLAALWPRPAKLDPAPT